MRFAAHSCGHIVINVVSYYYQVNRLPSLILEIYRNEILICCVSPVCAIHRRHTTIYSYNPPCCVVKWISQMVHCVFAEGPHSMCDAGRYNDVITTLINYHCCDVTALMTLGAITLFITTFRQEVFTS